MKKHKLKIVVFLTFIFLLTGIIGVHFSVKYKYVYQLPYNGKICTYIEHLNGVIRAQSYNDEFKEFIDMQSVNTGEVIVYTLKTGDNLYNYTLDYIENDKTLNFKFRENDELGFKFSNIVLNSVSFLSNKKFIYLNKDDIYSYNLEDKGFVYKNENGVINFKIKIDLENIYELYISTLSLKLIKDLLVTDDFIIMNKEDIKLYKFRDDKNIMNFYIVEEKGLAENSYISTLILLDNVLDEKYVEEFASKYNNNMYTDYSSECYQVQYGVVSSELDFDLGMKEDSKSSILIKLKDKCINDKNSINS